MARSKHQRTDVEAPPDDALGIQLWAYKLVASQLRNVANDRSLTDAKRRDLVLRHAQTLVPLMPRAALHNAQDAVLGETKAMESRKGPELEDAAQFDRPSSGTAARRGRPRKRSTL